MKKLTYLIVLPLLIAACSKSNNTTITRQPGEDNRCADRVQLQLRGLSVKDDTTVKALFAENGMSAGNLFFTSIVRTTTMQNGVTTEFIYVAALQQLNGLPCLNMNCTFSFRNRSLMLRDDVQATNVPDTIPTLKVSQVRSLFAMELNKNGMKNFADSCMDATFGYYNLSPGQPSANVVKAWKIKVRNMDFPYAYYKDDGALIHFENGVIFIL